MDITFSLKGNVGLIIIGLLVSEITLNEVFYTCDTIPITVYRFALYLIVFLLSNNSDILGL